MYLYIGLAIWFICGFVAWGISDGYMVVRHPWMRKESIDYGYLMAALTMGPIILAVNLRMYGFKHWTRRFWGKKKRAGWEMLLKMENS